MTRPAAGAVRRSPARAGAAVLALATVVSGSACSYRERVCREEDYPVRSIEYPDAGACARDGEPPPPGYETYPAGETPTYVDEQY